LGGVTVDFSELIEFYTFPCALALDPYSLGRRNGELGGKLQWMFNFFSPIVSPMLDELGFSELSLLKALSSKSPRSPFIEMEEWGAQMCGRLSHSLEVGSQQLQQGYISIEFEWTCLDLPGSPLRREHLHS